MKNEIIAPQCGHSFKVGDLVELSSQNKQRTGLRGVVLKIYDSSISKYPFAEVAWIDGEVSPHRLWRLEVVCK